MQVPIIGGGYYLVSKEFASRPPATAGPGPEHSTSGPEIALIQTWSEHRFVTVEAGFFKRVPTSMLGPKASWDSSIQLTVTSTSPLRIATTEFTPVDPNDSLTPSGGTFEVFVRFRSRESAKRSDTFDPKYGPIEQHWIMIWPQGARPES